MQGWIWVLLMVIFSPVVETLGLALTILVISRFNRKPHIIALVSALAWGLLHSTARLTWGLYVLWSFYLWSRIYMTWRPTGFWRACFVVACIHAADNLIPALAILVLICLG